MSGQSPMTVAERLAARLMRPVSGADRKRAAFHVLDWTGCAIAGARRPAAMAIKRAVGDSREVLFWGALGNILEMDDVDKRALLHPGPVVIAAALAAAGRSDASGADLLDAVVRGYEATIRVGRAVGPEHYRYWHNTGTCGPFGAAAAASSLLRLDAERCALALGLAGTQASGLWQVRDEPHSHAKQLHTARAADAGLLAAELSSAGFVGLRSIFEGPQGFFAATCGQAEAEAVIAFDADAPWTIHEVSFKPWPACRHAHAAIDAALALRRDGVRADTIAWGVISVYRDAIVFCDKPTPTDPLSAKFSLQHAVAAAFVADAPTLDDFEGEGLVRRDIADIRARFSVAEDPAITARYPERFGASIDVELTDGSRRRFEARDALGDPENPMDAAAIEAKARMLMAHAGLEDRAAERLATSALALGEGGSVGDYLHRLRAGLAS